MTMSKLGISAFLFAGLVAITVSSPAHAIAVVPTYALSPNVEDVVTMSSQQAVDFTFTVPGTGNWYFEASAPPAGDNLSLVLTDQTNAAYDASVAGPGAAGIGLHDGDA